MMVQQAIRHDSMNDSAGTNVPVSLISPLCATCIRKNTVLTPSVGTWDALRFQLTLQ